MSLTAALKKKVGETLHKRTEEKNLQVLLATSTSGTVKHTNEIVGHRWAKCDSSASAVDLQSDF